MTNNPVKLFLKKQRCFPHNSSKTILDQDEKKPLLSEWSVCRGTNLISQFVPISVYGYLH